jgi:hypothetical protein
MTLSSKELTIPPGAQVARLGTDLFPDVTASGWVYVLNDTEGMQAFWLTYNADLTAMDGAEAAGYDTIGTDQIIPLVAAQTELNLINPNFLNVQTNIRLFGPKCRCPALRTASAIRPTAPASCRPRRPSFAPMIH